VRRASCRNDEADSDKHPCEHAQRPHRVEQSTLQYKDSLSLSLLRVLEVPCTPGVDPVSTPGWRKEGEYSNLEKYPMKKGIALG